MRWGISFWGYALWSFEEGIKLEQEIFKILFPNITYDYMTYCKENNIEFTEGQIDLNWKNKMCDAVIMWCHIYYKGDIFVTSDRNFHKLTKRQRLMDLGANHIMYPEEALHYIISKQKEGKH